MRLQTLLDGYQRYLELAVSSEVSGVDYHAAFLVPIYAAADRRLKWKKKSSRAA